ncbi:MAG TPA: methylthioribulose 1-phosphate dehydratase [Chlamydiales bacterium]|nr:methylthioribulose 1-phosphate dehydratase [Chlamydiales bacterium]
MNKFIFAAVLLPLLGMGNPVEKEFLGKAAEEIVQAGRFLNDNGLCPATSGNFSIRLGPDLFAITVSGKHKGELCTDDVMLVNLQGMAQHSSKKPSAETAIHTVIYSLMENVGAILHTHSVSGTVLSRILAPKTSIVTEGYEMHKALGIPTHESRVEIPIFENSQDYPTLAAEIAEYIRNHPKIYGFYLRGHGLYTWGKDMKEAKIRVETFEFLFDCELKTAFIKNSFIIDN